MADARRHGRVARVPSQGAAREILEELGIPLTIGRPLVMQWLQAADDPDGVLHFTYDGGVLDARTIDQFRLPPSELISCRFLEPRAVATLASEVTTVRIGAALDALAHHTFIELVS